MQLFKVLNDDGSALHGGNGIWNLPQNGQPGDWMPPIEGELIACENGYHLCRSQDLIHWLGPAIYEAEHKGDLIEGDGKVVVRQARLLRSLEMWNDRTARLFACNCAEHVLHIFEKCYPDDARPRQSIEIARKFANGQATKDELDAAWAAAGNAAGAAAGAAAWAAARAAARAAAWDAAWDAARAAAGNAAGNAAWDAAWAAETRWQSDLLISLILSDS